MAKRIETSKKQPTAPVETGVPAGLQRPSLWLYAVAAVTVLLGQVGFFSQNMGVGLLLTAVAVLLFLLARLGDAKLLQVVAAFRDPLEGMGSRWQKLFGLPENGPTAPEETENSQPALTDKVKKKTGSAPEASPAWTTPLLEINFDIPKPWVLGIGIGLILFSQPLFYIEKFIPALALAVPGASFLVYALLSKEKFLHIGRLDQIAKFLILALPGLACMLIGHWLIYTYLEINFPKEVAGYVLNSIGIFLILAILPKVMIDPEPTPVPILEQISPELRGRKDLLMRLGLGAAAVLCFYLSSESHKSDPIFFWALAGLACLALTFPWVRSSQPNTSMAARLFRLLILVGAVFLGYRGQTLISQEQLYPGLYYFLAAAVALWFALREPPADGREDTGREQPLAWYWEAAGLAVILAVGFYLRFHKLDIMPYGVECDEAGAAAETVDILKNNFSSLAVHPCGRPLFMLLPNVVSYFFLGTDSVGVRGAAMFFGVAGILVMYLMARHFYGPRIALAVSALFAVSRWHIHFSRFGWSNTLMLVLIMLGFYMVVKGLASRRKWHFVIAGVAWGLTIQTETAARMLPIICLMFLGYLAVTQRHFFRRNWKPVLTLMLGVWLVATGIFLFWIHKPNMLYKRVYEVSIFSGDTNAPVDYVRGLIDSARLSLTQLNWHGDYRQRHNGGLSGEPVADFWTAILFALGMGYSLFHWKRLRHFVPLIWFFGFMGASIFAIEAPQSHRAFGVFPAVFLLIAAFLDRTRRLLRETLGRPGVVAAALLFCVLLVPITVTNAKKYFEAWPAFDTNVTAAAKYMGRSWPKAEHVVFTAFTWLGHPPFKLYARDVLAHLYYAASEGVPFRHATDRDVVFTFIMEYPPILPTVKWFYPNGKFTEETHPKYGLQFQGWAVSHDEIMRTRGLKGRYYNNLDYQGKPAVVRNDSNFNLELNAKTWPLPGPGSVAWEGTLLVPHAGHYTFAVSGEEYVDLRLGSRHFLQADNGREAKQTFWLAGGLHSIRVHVRHTRSQARIRLAWSGAEGVNYYLYDDTYQSAFPQQPLDPTHLFTYPEPVGLLSAFYGSDRWQGTPVVQKVEPALFYFWSDIPYGLPHPFSADWKGSIKITQAGEYRFDMEPSCYGEMELDGKLVISKGTPPAGWKVSTAAQNPVWLSAGSHTVTVRWSTSSGWSFKWFWTPPGKQQSEVVPAWVLSPQEE